MLIFRIPILASMAAASGSAAALAQTPAFSLAWDAPASCPGPGYVRSAVEQLVAGGDASLAHVDAHARVERCSRGDAWCVRLTTVRNGETGERLVESSSCRSLADATALIVAVTIDPERAAEPQETAVGHEPSKAEALASAKETAAALRPLQTPQVDTSVAEAPSPSHVAILAQASSHLGTLSQPAYGLTVGTALMFGALRLEGYAAYWAAQAAPADSAPLADVKMRLTVGGLRGCYVPWRGRLEISGCSGLELGDLHTQSSPAGIASQPLGIGESMGGAPSTVLPGAPVDSLWMSATASARAFWKLTPFLGLALDIGLAFPLRREAFASAAPGTFAETGWAAGRASIGPEARF